MGRVEDTYKARDVEEIIDIHVYRPWGYWLAVQAKRLRMSPNSVTVVGTIVGVFAGHLFFYDSLVVNLAGILMWGLGQALDGADGQLARMTNTRSQLGRILDGLSDSTKFLSLYFHLGARLVIAHGAWWPLALMWMAGYTHSMQSGLADMHRNLYLWWVYGSGKSEVEDPDVLRARFAELRWRDHFLEKLFTWVYVGYITRMEQWGWSSLALLREAAHRYGSAVPESLRALYRSENRRLLRGYNALTTNTRMVVLYICLLAGYVIPFFLFEIVVLNGVMILLYFRLQPRADRRIQDEMERLEDTAT
jgi:phosphatidylglycerophosphate synthase